MPDVHRSAGGARNRMRALPAAPAQNQRACDRHACDRHACDQQGAVTAETAVALPVLVGLTLGLVWLVALAATQVRVVDAARETARALARDEPVASAIDLGRRVAPAGADITVHEGVGEVRVHVVAQVRGPGGLFGFLPGVDVDADAVTAQEGP